MARAVPGLLLVTTVAALVLRLTHLRWVLPYEVSTPAPAGMDRALAMQLAAAIAGGDWTGGWAAPYDSSPGYGYLLAALHRVSGGRWDGPLYVQMALGSLVPLLLYDATRRLHGWPAGLIAAALAAAYVPAVFYEGLLVKFSVVPVVTAALLCATVRLPDGGWWPMAAGVAQGALALLRPNTLVVAPLLVAWAALEGERRTAARRLLALLAGIALVLGPMAVRDRMAARRGLESALGGIHFYIGTNPAADGEYVIVPGIRPDIVGHVADARRLAEERVARPLTPAEVSRFWFDEGLRFIREQPGRYALLQLRKLWFALEADEMGSFGDDFDELAHLSPVLRLPAVLFGTIIPLALLGALFATGSRRAAIVPAIAGALLVSLLPFFVAGRYRLPLAPPTIVLAAAGLARLARWWRTGRRATAAAALGVAAVVGILLGQSDVELLAFLLVAAASVWILASLDEAA